VCVGEREIACACVRVCVCACVRVTRGIFRKFSSVLEIFSETLNFVGPPDYPSLASQMLETGQKKVTV